jgi:putative Mn2+ efflux pump MntP
LGFIGITTFTLSAVGLVIGNKLGARSKSKAELLGGVVLICMGTKILLEHLGFIG